MTFDFSSLSGTDFALGAFGATFVEIYRLKRLLDKNGGELKGSKLQLVLNIVWFLLFISGSGLLAALQGVSPLLSAFCAGLTAPVFFSVIFRDNAEAERELVAKAKKTALAEAEVETQKVLAVKEEELEELRNEMSMILKEYQSLNNVTVHEEEIEWCDNPPDEVMAYVKRMNQENKDSSRGFQTRVEGGTIDVSEILPHGEINNASDTSAISPSPIANRYSEVIQSVVPF